ncbi:glycosyl hydrolase family 28 protein [Gaoshiqia sp. Z1-71]|uniref:glycosyl hydrolase family 28 protein n=1 Tax=Gaoshiqia hydrogeniformans TaxID=3290090 RepID=UPI003BF80E30
MRLLSSILLFCISIALYAQELVTYDAPGGMKYAAHNDDFTVQVRKPGGEWLDLFEWKVHVDMDDLQTASMVSFDFEGEVDVRIRKNNGAVNSVQIRPLSYGIVPEVNGQVIDFSLDQPRKISLEVNGDKLHNLHLFANSVLEEKPDPNDPNVIYFGPGIHQPKDLQNVIVDGPVFINPSHYTIYGGQTTGLTVRNIKSFSCKGWSDGIDLMSCSDVLIDDVFMRNSDDCIAIYGHRWYFYGSSRNYEIKNSTLWADIAHPTNIGLHGNSEAGGDTIENITFSNIDILEHDEDDRDYQGCMAITCSDNNLIRSITYENIRVEDFQEGQLFNFRVVYNEKYSGAPGRGIENVLLKNIQCDGNSANPSIISGYDKNRMVKGVRIDGLKINGRLIENIADGDIRVGEFSDNLTFGK